MPLRLLPALISALALTTPAAAAPAAWVASNPNRSDLRLRLDTQLQQAQSGRLPGLEVAGPLTTLHLSATTRCYGVPGRRGTSTRICDVEDLSLDAEDAGRRRSSTRATLDALEGRWAGMMVAVSLRSDGRIQDIQPIRASDGPEGQGRVDATDRQIAEWLFRPLDAAAPPAADASRWAWRGSPLHPRGEARKQRMAAQVELRIGDITEVRSTLARPQGDEAQNALHVFNADEGWLFSGEVEWSGPSDPAHPEAGRTQLSARFHTAEAQGHDPEPAGCASSGC